MKKNPFTFVFLFCILFSNAQVPTFQWLKGFQGGPLYAHSVVRDAANNLYAFGDFQGMVDFQPGPGGPWFMTSQGTFPGTDVFVVKYDASGNFIWAEQINNSDADYAEEMAYDGSGNLFVTGYFQDVVLPTSYMTFIAKVDASTGFVNWRNTIGPAVPNGTDAVQSQGICTDVSSNVYVTGAFDNTIDFDAGAGTFTMSASQFNYDEAYILKMNSFGGFVWAKQLNGTGSSYCTDVVADNAGNIYCTGKFNGTSDFDPGPGTFTLSSPTSTTSCAFIWKLSTAGNLIWAKQIDYASSFRYNICMDNSSNIYCTGVFNGITDFDTGPGTYTLNSTNGEAYIVKMDAGGNFIWAKQFGGTPQSITTDITGNPFISGWFANTVDMDPGPSTYSFTSLGGNDGFINKLDINGNFLWADQIGSSSSWEDVEDICIGSTGDVYGVGMDGSTTDFDPGPAVVNPIYSWTYVLKLGQSPTAIKAIDKTSIGLMYPNPTSGQFNLLFDYPIENAELKIVNSLGQTVLQKTILHSDKLSLNITEQPTGIYFVEISANENKYWLKIIKQ